jgi:hypothetical protein
MMRALNSKIAVPIRILMIFIVCQALLLSFMPFVSFSSQPEETRAEPHYHTYEEMTTEILEIAQENSSLVMVENLTTTYEGKTVWAVKISDSPQINDSTEPDILFMAGHRANSLISVEIAMYLINHLTSNYGIDGSITELINTREIWIIPMVNPDGHEYVSNETANWEKNRRNNQDETFGVNLNRNYGYEWGEDEHTSSDSVSQNYHGTGVFSEPETLAIKNLVQSQDFVFSLAFSSNGEMITYPWGHTNSSTSADELLSEIANDMAMYNGYSTMQSSQFEKNRGNADDWLYSEADVLPFTIYAGDEDIPQEGEIESIASENLAACLYLLDIADDPDRAMTAQWTFMVYMGADNNLENEGIADFNEMEIEGSNPYVNIAVQFDRTPSNDDTSNGNWVDTRRYLVMKDYDTNIINSPLKGVLGEKNMGDPQTLLDFVNWSMTNYPAEHYFLDIWGHGKGWQGVSLDSTGNDWLYLNEIKSVLPKFKDRIDVVGFDNCNMAMMEVYSTFLGYTDYIVGSEKEEDANGWPYDRIFKDLNADPFMSTANLPKIIATHYVDWAENTSWYSAAVSVVDMNYLDSMINRTDELAKELNRTLSLFYYEINLAVTRAEKYAQNPNPRDLYHFAELLVKYVDNTLIKNAAEKVMSGFKNLILANEYWTSPHEDPPVPVDHAHGITVWLYDGGSQSLLDKYKVLDYAILTHWDEFLEAYRTAPTKPQVSFINDYVLGDTNSDDNYDTITLDHETNVSGLNIVTEIFNNENDHVSTLYWNNTEQGTQYFTSFNPYDDLPPDYYSFYSYLEDSSGTPQNYSEVVNIWLGNEKPDIVLNNMTIFRMDGTQVGNETNKNPIDGEDTEIKVLVTNVGTNDLFNVKVDVFEGENSIISEVLGELKIGEGKNITALWESKSGIKTLKAVVDLPNNIKEINENNNEIMETIEVDPHIPVEPLIVRGKIFNKENINIIGARVRIRNLRTNETLNRTTDQNGYRAEMAPDWYLEGDEIEVRATYNSVSDNENVFAYSDDEEIYANVTLETDLYDALFYFKMGLIIFEMIGFALVINYGIKVRRMKKRE